MAQEKEPTIEAREVPSSSSSSRWPLNDDVEAGGKQQPPPLPQWPTEPQPLEQSKLSYWVGIILDVALIIAPLLLIMKTGLVIYAYSLDIGKSGLPGGQPITELTLKLTEFNSQLVTLFTIIFITTVATVVRRYALYKAQIGASVTQLEQYQASISLPSTLKMVVLLRAWNWVSLLLVFIWSWYYLGSQAAQREYTYALSAAQTDTRVVFAVSNAPSFYDDYQNITSIEQKLVDGRWFSSFASTVTESGKDQEGSAIAPFLIQAPDVKVVEGEEKGWLMLDRSGIGAPRDSSTSGKSIWHATDTIIGSQWLGSYTATYTYLYTTCGDLESRNASDFPAGVLPTLATSINATTESKDGFPVIDIWKRTANLTAHTTCTIGQQSIDIKAGCDGRSCAVNEFRATPAQAELRPATYFSDKNRTNAFFGALLVAGGIPQTLEEETIFEIFIRVSGKTGVWKPQFGGESLPLCLSQSLSQLMNGYYAASQPNSGLFGYDDLLDGGQMVGINAGTIQNATWSTGSAHGAIFSPQYNLSWVWIGIDLATCVILLICAVFSFRLHKVTVAPDIFGYVSSMTRDNPNLRLPDGGSAMSGVDRARALKNIKVKLTDLNANGTAAGRIGLTRADDVTGDKRLSRTKHYL